jgi:predicted nucleotidyltransferase
VVCALLGGCGSEREAESAKPAPVEWFTDETAASGLDFVHVNGMSGGFYFPEIMAPGVGVLDYDNDGDLDIFFVQCHVLGPGKTLTNLLIRPPAQQLPLRGRLYRNDLELRPDGTRSLRFTDVTASSGIDARGYGMGVAAGDVNNDGCIDVYVTNVGPNQLFRNNCDGTFTDVSRPSGAADPGWGVSAAFFDYNRDGWLDLYVGNYVEYAVDEDKPCISVTGGRDYCPPRAYRGQSDRLYRNRGNGTFLDVTAEALLGADRAPALGVSTADFNGDGWMDVYVANDGEANQLWINQREGTFRNTAPLAGVAFNRDGRAQGSMGVDAGDFDNNGTEDLFVTNLTGETNTLYVNHGGGTFEDRTAASGLGTPSLTYTGFGTAWIDVDNDGWLDLLTVNGTIVRSQQAPANAVFPYDQRKQLFRNLGTGRFEEVTDRAGAVFRRSEVGRGAAFGDINNDGTMDVVVANANGPARLLINHAGRQHHWLGLRLVGGAATPRDMLGARVAVVRADGSTLWRRARADGSYGSANDPRVLVGLGDAAGHARVRVTWPSGRVDEWPRVPIDRWTTLHEGAHEQ